MVAMSAPSYLLSPHEQGTPGWLLDRAGRATGSMADAVCAQGRSGEAVTRRNYRYQLACERLTGRPQESGYSNAHMERGRELEPLARAAYENATGSLVRTAGFAYWPTLPIGCSVDGFVGGHAHEAPAGFVEIKCPLPAIHIDYLEANRVPPAYVKQILHNLLVTGCSWCDFVSFNKEFPPELQLFIFRAERSRLALDIATYESELRKFLAEVEALTHHLSELGSRRRIA
jgi:hypothetical protein